MKAGGEGDDRGWDGWMDHQLNGYELEQALGVGEVQGSLACCSLWGCKESDMTEWLNRTEPYAVSRKTTLSIKTKIS